MKVEELPENGRRLKSGRRVEILHIQTLAAVGKGFSDLLIAPPAPGMKSPKLYQAPAVASLGVLSHLADLDLAPCPSSLPSPSAVCPPTPSSPPSASPAAATQVADAAASKAGGAKAPPALSPSHPSPIEPRLSNPACQTWAHI